jgi:hypothetical protein
MIHPQIIAPGQDGCWSGARVHDAYVQLCLSTPRALGPFIGDSSRMVKMRMARHLHLRPSHWAGAEPLGSGVQLLFAHGPFPDAGLGSPPVAGGMGVPDRGCGVLDRGCAAGWDTW